MDKRTTVLMSQVMMPNQANLAGNVHGGEIMMFMDNVAGAVASKYSRSNVVTARVDEIQFILPIFVGAFVTCTGTIAYVGSTSMEVYVTVDVEDLHSEREPQRALNAFFTMVALDRGGRPQPVKPLVPETEEEKELYAAALARRARKKNNDC